MTVLQQIIDAWHAAHPDAVLRFECVPIRSSDPADERRVWAAEARRRRIPEDEYRRHRLAGERYCTHHRAWHDETKFSRAISQSRTVCMTATAAYQRAQHRWARDMRS